MYKRFIFQTSLLNSTFYKGELHACDTRNTQNPPEINNRLVLYAMDQKKILKRQKHQNSSLCPNDPHLPLELSVGY